MKWWEIDHWSRCIDLLVCELAQEHSTQVAIIYLYQANVLMWANIPMWATGPHLLPVLLGGAVADGQAAADEVVLDIHDDERSDGAHHLCGGQQTINVLVTCLARQTRKYVRLNVIINMHKCGMAFTTDCCLPNTIFYGNSHKTFTMSVILILFYLRVGIKIPVKHKNICWDICVSSYYVKSIYCNFWCIIWHLITQYKI